MKDNIYTYTARKAPEPVDLQVVGDCIDEAIEKIDNTAICLYHAFLLEEDNEEAVAILGLYLTAQRLEEKVEEYQKDPIYKKVTRVKVISIPQAEFPNKTGLFTLAIGEGGVGNEGF